MHTNSALILVSVLSSCLFILSPPAKASEEPSLTIYLDSGSYNPTYNDGEVIVISGLVSDPDEDVRKFEGLDVKISHYRSDGDKISTSSVEISANGTFSHSILARDGYGFEQRIVAQYEANGRSLIAEQKFKVFEAAPKLPALSDMPVQTHIFTVGEKKYSLQYQSFTELGLGFDAESAVVSGSSPEDPFRSNFFAIFVLPRSLIDSKDDSGKDIEFYVVSETGRTLLVKELETRSDARVIQLSVSNPQYDHLRFRFYIIGNEAAGERASDGSIIASLDQTEYPPGASALVSGSIPDRGTNYPVILSMTSKQDSNAVFSTTVVPEYYGNFSVLIPIDEDMRIGDYNVDVRYLAMKESLNLTVMPLPDDTMNPVSVSNVVKLAVLSGLDNESVNAKDNATIGVKITSNSTVGAEIPILVIVEVRDKITQITEFLDVVEGKFSNNNSDLDLEIAWVPDHSGSFEIRAFTLTGDGSDQSISEVMSSEVAIL